jgi:glutathione synthase/RimK-type ligase-like ATP-grasp enzyme
VIVGLVTCESLPDLTEDDQVLAGELTRLGVQAIPVIWSDERNRWSGFDRLVLRSCWDYHQRHQEFLAWLQDLERLGVPVVNPPDVVRWNMHKRYLAELRAKGVQVPGCMQFERDSGASLSSVLQSTGWQKAVIKPAISASATGLWYVDIAQGVDEQRFRDANANVDLLVQQFVPDVVSGGEWSLVFLGGAFSHAVLKRSIPGEFRVQSEFGGSVRSQVPDEAMVSWASGVTRQVPGAWSYARVDAVETRDGYMLMEVECIEPELFLRQDSGAARRAANVFADPAR